MRNFTHLCDTIVKQSILCLFAVYKSISVPTCAINKCINFILSYLQPTIWLVVVILRHILFHKKKTTLKWS